MDEDFTITGDLVVNGVDGIITHKDVIIKRSVLNAKSIREKVPDINLLYNTITMHQRVINKHLCTLLFTRFFGWLDEEFKAMDHYLRW